MLTKLKIWLIGKLLPENYEIVQRKSSFKIIHLSKEDYNVHKVSFSDCG